MPVILFFESCDGWFEFTVDNGRELRVIFNFRVSGNEEQVVEFEKELLDILNRIFGDEDMVAHEIHFCTHEAILNIIQHTYKWDLDKAIEVKMTLSDLDSEGNRVLEIKIKDSGPSLEKEIIPPESIDKFQMRKRGLYMISKIMDEFYIKPLENSGNLTYMKKLITRDAEEMMEIPDNKLT